MSALSLTAAPAVMAFAQHVAKSTSDAGTASTGAAIQPASECLTCNVSSGWGSFFGLTRDLHCTHPAGCGTVEHSIGHIDKMVFS